MSIAIQSPKTCRTVGELIEALERFRDDSLLAGLNEGWLAAFNVQVCRVSIDGKWADGGTYVGISVGYPARSGGDG